MKKIKLSLIGTLSSFSLFAQRIDAINPSSAILDYSIRGIMSSTTAGSFSAAVRGISNSTNSNGIGVYGSHNSGGWGVYGVSSIGIGVYGNATGSGGVGVYAQSTSGIGLSAYSTNNIAGNFSIGVNTNNNPVINASTIGNGPVANIKSFGSGSGVISNTGAGFSIHGITTAQISAGIFGENTGGGEAVVGINTSNIGGAVVGRNDGGGYGVRGFIATNTTHMGIGVLGQVGINNSTGRAGRFENSNAQNTEANTFEVETVGNGNVPNNKLGNAASFRVNNTYSVAAGLRSEVNTIFSNFGAAGVFGVSSGTGGVAGLFHATNTSGSGAALIAITDGNGNAITANAGKNGNAIEANIDGAGNALYAWVPNFATGKAGRFEIQNINNTNEVITVKTIGDGIGVNAKVDRTTGTSAALKGEVNSQFANFGTAGVYGISSGTGGYAGLFYSSNSQGNGPAVLALAEGYGNAITASADNTGDGVEASADGTGNAIYGWTPNYASSRAARFSNFNTSNSRETVLITNAGTGTNLLINHSGTSGNLATFQSGGTNVARINKAGRGFFNGGTQTSGADIAEAFDVSSSVNDFEPGDVLVIAVNKDRTVEKSTEPYSTLVAGVYATKPGVLLTEEDIDSDLTGKAPMGVVGVIPTKVCLEGGPIKRGDLLVTSSIAGVAMKADRTKVEVGQVLGKALQEFNDETIGKINVLVNVK